MTWMSWAQLMPKEAPAVAHLMIKQNKIFTRPCSALDHDDPAIAELDWTDRMQVKYIEQTYAQSHITEESALNKSEASTASPSTSNEEQQEKHRH